MRGHLIICCLLFSWNAVAQEPDSLRLADRESIPTRKTLGYRLHQLQDFLDKKARKSVDSNYIEVPVKPWRIILRSKLSDIDVDFDNSIEDPPTKERLDWRMTFSPPLAASVGFWVGYRGTGIALSKSVTKKKAFSFSFSTTGSRYGLNLRLKSFESDEASLNATLYENDEVYKEDLQGRLGAPVSIASLYLNGYYVFNGRRYSQAAAYSQSVIQRRSAGSFLAGATWYMASFDYGNVKNAAMIILSHNVHRLQIHQGSIGAGYGYNFVPTRGLIINAMVMPTVSVYNRVKAFKYDCNYTPFSGQDETDDYGVWNQETHKWANGKDVKSLFLVEDESWMNDVDFWEAKPETEYSWLHFDADVRAGIAYNWKKYFVGAQAQINHFSSKKDKSRVTIFDWYARISLGVRL